VTTQLQLLLIAVAGWMSRHQQAVIEYLQEENRILLEQLGGKPKRFTDVQRIRLARKAKLVGRRRLGKLATLVTPDTLRWFRVLVAKKWTFPKTNPLGRLSAAAMNSAGCSTITTAKACELPFSMVSRVFW
jgi:putative transposase